jgi:thymidylate synthase
MSIKVTGDDFGYAWHSLLDTLMHNGEVVAPRGMAIREHRSTVLTVENGLKNILHSPARRLNYRFMVAEWLWIWFGHNDVRSIKQYNPKIAEFSDDGEVFSGAYGPPLRDQWGGVISKLMKDRDSRQAVIQIYSTPRKPTKDVPCTIALQFLIRQAKLHVIAYMRSSDIWLGLPYDFFNFSMLGNIAAGTVGVDMGSVTFHLGSSHLYESNLEAAERVLRSEYGSFTSPQLKREPPLWLNDVLNDRDDYRQTIEASSPWSQYAGALLVNDNETALNYLRTANAITTSHE